MSSSYVNILSELWIMIYSEFWSSHGQDRLTDRLTDRQTDTKRWIWTHHALTQEVFSQIYLKCVFCSTSYKKNELGVFHIGWLCHWKRQYFFGRPNTRNTDAQHIFRMFIIDCEAREITRLVASVCPSVDTLTFEPFWPLSLIFGMRSYVKVKRW